MAANKHCIGYTPFLTCTHDNHKRPVSVQAEFYSDGTDMITLRVVNENGELIRKTKGTSITRSHFDSIRYDNTMLLQLLGWEICDDNER